MDGAIVLKTDNMSFPNELYAQNLKLFQLHPDYRPGNIPNLVLFKLDGTIQVGLKPTDLPELVWFFPLDKSGR